MTAASRLRARMESRLGPALTARLDAQLSWKTAGRIGETPDVAFWRSVDRIESESIDMRAAICLLLERGGSSLLPPLPVVTNRILAPAVSGLTACGISTGPTLGKPVAASACVSFNWVIRLWQPNRELAAKVRVGAFLDERGDLYWEFGVAGRTPPSIEALRQGLMQAADLAPQWQARIDLTPSHRGAAWLALRLGGRADDHGQYRQQLRCAEAWTELRKRRLLLPAPVRRSRGFEPLAGSGCC